MNFKFGKQGIRLKGGLLFKFKSSGRTIKVYYVRNELNKEFLLVRIYKGRQLSKELLFTENATLGTFFLNILKYKEVKKCQVKRVEPKAIVANTIWKNY